MRGGATIHDKRLPQTAGRSRRPSDTREEDAASILTERISRVTKYTPSTTSDTSRYSQRRASTKFAITKMCGQPAVALGQRHPCAPAGIATAARQSARLSAAHTTQRCWAVTPVSFVFARHNPGYCAPWSSIGEKSGWRRLLIPETRPLRAPGCTAEANAGHSSTTGHTASLKSLPIAVLNCLALRWSCFEKFGTLLVSLMAQLRWRGNF